MGIFCSIEKCIRRYLRNIGSIVKDGDVYIIIDDTRYHLLKRYKGRYSVSIQQIGQKQACRTICKSFTFDR